MLWLRTSLLFCAGLVMVVISHLAGDRVTWWQVILVLGTYEFFIYIYERFASGEEG